MRSQAMSSSSAIQVMSPTPFFQATMHENQTWPSTLAMAASMLGVDVVGEGLEHHAGHHVGGGDRRLAGGRGRRT